jgi:uncharacterized protein (DUF1330 family)
MEAKFEIAVALITSVIVGAVTIEHFLHVQPKPPVYFITEIDVKDVDTYEKKFVPLVRASVKHHGGKPLAAGPKVTPLDGAPPKRVVINLWDDMESLQAWRNSADYREARETGEKYATFRSYTLEDESK